MPRLSITFSQPMVPVGSLADLAQEHGPVRLSPQPAGRWRWIGTRTLVFEPDGERFPMATEYRVEVPAGTASQGGGRLAEAAAWTFRTPPPRVVRSLPTGGPTVREPTFVVGFDQRVDPGAVLEAIRVEAAGARVALRLATAEEANGLGRPGRSVVFRAQEPLPPNAAVSVKVGPGVPSAEGPRRSAEPATYAFRTYGPLKITGHRSGWGSDCPPGAPFQVTFSNPLDGEAFSDEQFSADPEIPGLNAWVNGNTLILRGLTRANTRYRITFRAGIRDAFGQTLGADRALDFRTTDPEPRLYGVGGDVIVLDPDGKPRTTVRSIAVDELRVRIYAVDPAKDWRAYQVWRGRLHDRNRRAEPPGRVVYDEEVEPDGSDDEWIETAIDLAPALKGGLGHAVVYVEPVDWPERRWRPTVASWVQATQLGLDLQADPTEAAGVGHAAEGRGARGRGRGLVAPRDRARPGDGHQ